MLGFLTGLDQVAERGPDPVLECGTSGLTRYVDCGNEVYLGWQRWATEDEVDRLHEMGELPASETAATVPVYGCADHELDSELAAQIHDATCRAPAEPGDCSVCQGSGS